jgi:hypothetical protein
MKGVHFRPMGLILLLLQLAEHLAQISESLENHNQRDDQKGQACSNHTNGPDP